MHLGKFLEKFHSQFLQETLKLYEDFYKGMSRRDSGNSGSVLIKDIRDIFVEIDPAIPRKKINDYLIKAFNISTYESVPDDMAVSIDDFMLRLKRITSYQRFGPRPKDLFISEEENNLDVDEENEIDDSTDVDNNKTLFDLPSTSYVYNPEEEDKLILLVQEDNAYKNPIAPVTLSNFINPFSNPNIRKSTLSTNMPVSPSLYSKNDRTSSIISKGGFVQNRTDSISIIVNNNADKETPYFNAPDSTRSRKGSNGDVSKRASATFNSQLSIHIVPPLQVLPANAYGINILLSNSKSNGFADVDLSKLKIVS